MDVTTQTTGQRTLQRLVLDLKGDRSYERLSRDCGGYPTDKRLQQIATSDARAFPDARTIQGLARGLGVTVTEVVLAAAASLGLRVHAGGDPSAVTLAGLGELPSSARSAVLSVVREMVRLHESAGDESWQHDPHDDVHQLRPTRSADVPESAVARSPERPRRRTPRPRHDPLK